MKQFTITTLAASVLLSGCTAFGGIQGSGTAAKVSMSTDGITQIEIQGMGQLTVAPTTDAPELGISGDHNLLEELLIERVGKKLIIKPKSRFYGSWKPTMPLQYSLNHAVESVDLSGSIDLIATDLVQPSFYLAVAGSSDVSVNLQVNEFAVDVAGSGSIDATGSAQQLRMDVSGSGKVLADELSGNSAYLRGIGSSYMTLGEYQVLEVSAIGSSTVVYAGEPKVSANSIGSATVAKAQ